jgi:hypothetical protein
MRKAVAIRVAVFAVTVSLACGVASASADVIVYYNLSHITGEAFVSNGGMRILSDSYGSGELATPVGSWAIADAAAASQLGASGAASSNLDISISPALCGDSRAAERAADDVDASEHAPQWLQRHVVAPDLSGGPAVVEAQPAGHRRGRRRLSKGDAALGPVEGARETPRCRPATQD